MLSRTQVKLSWISFANEIHATIFYEAHVACRELGSNPWDVVDIEDLPIFGSRINILRSKIPSYGVPGPCRY